MFAIRVDMFMLCLFMGMMLSNAIATQHLIETGDTLFGGFSREPLREPMAALNVSDEAVNNTQSNIISPKADPTSGNVVYYTGWGFLINAGWWISALWNSTLGLSGYLQSFGVLNFWADCISWLINLGNLVGLFQFFSGRSEGGIT